MYWHISPIVFMFSASSSGISIPNSSSRAIITSTASKESTKSVPPQLKQNLDFNSNLVLHLTQYLTVDFLSEFTNSVHPHSKQNLELIVFFV